MCAIQILLSFIEFLRSFCIHGEACAKILCSEKELERLNKTFMVIRLVLSDWVTNNVWYTYTVNDNTFEGENFHNVVGSNVGKTYTK